MKPGFDLHTWNRKIYDGPDGKPLPGSWNAKELWEKFQIKSGPLFPDACWSFIPAKWVEDVTKLIEDIRLELSDKIEFVQIKEKYGRLTIYYDNCPKEERDRLEEHIERCRYRLREKDLHP